MGSKFKYLVIVLSFFFFNFAVKAQIDIDFQSIDSLTYRYYKSGDWNNLINLGNKAIEHGIDYKYLRQRLGLAFFSNGDYFEARKHFEKALSFDSFDTFTLVYLYYTYLNMHGILQVKFHRTLEKAYLSNHFNRLRVSILNTILNSLVQAFDQIRNISI
jgi:tetratricopeptide (TPR) repeat protein